MLGLDPSLGTRRAVRRAAARARPARAASTPSMFPRRPAAASCRSGPIAGSPTTTASAAIAVRSRTSAARAVRFAAECLAFSNVPDEAAIEEMPPEAPRAARRSPSRAGRPGVPRDVGSGWDFEDVRDHYLGLLFGVDPAELAAGRPRALSELSRAVTGEVMAEVFGEWRRAASPCGGGLVLWLRDLRARRRLGRDRPPRRSQARLPLSRRALAPGRRLDDRRGPGRRRGHTWPTIAPSR